ncbi:hypothetical protein ES319_A02G143700v1 [Gossypium barbadense]|uniref:Uncharacterized protein n=2 Tax=Gossypium TaxID=3633 RepID=A0A5J5WQ36_GOSBA|nr:hypothetical protein ES319_A02G143700v1 [Gossypium barbadense]TYH28633.1 hypothetical protein ES288_A02G159300v1 [Gossypium darwinii]
MVFLVVYFTPIVVQFNWHCLQILRHLGLDRVRHIGGRSSSNMKHLIKPKGVMFDATDTCIEKQVIKT